MKARTSSVVDFKKDHDSHGHGQELVDKDEERAFVVIVADDH